jgi:hypothetical protein
MREERALILLRELLHNLFSQRPQLVTFPILEFQDMSPNDEELNVGMKCLREVIGLRREIAIDHRHLIQ